MQLDDLPPHYISSATMLPDPDAPAGPIWLTDPIGAIMYYVVNLSVYASNISSPPDVSVVQLFPATVGSKRNYTIFVLSQQAADQPMHVTQLDSEGGVLQQWNGTGQGGGAVPHIGVALYVDSSASMYISDHGRHDDSSPYGRVVKLLANGSEAGEWTMSDGVAYAFTSLAYDDTPSSGGSCALWATEAEQGLYRLAEDGTVLQPAYAAPFDPVDKRNASFSGMAQDVGATDSTLVLLDSSDPSTTKLWRFSLANHTYTPIDTCALLLGPNITGLAVDRFEQYIYLADTNTRTVLSLSSTGELRQRWNASLHGFVEPVGLALIPTAYQTLYVADSGYNGAGAVLLLNGLDANIPAIALPQSSPHMYRPLTVAADTGLSRLYVSDSNGLVFQYDLGSSPHMQREVHQPVPAAHTILSMTAGRYSTMYLLDVYSRRLIIVSNNASDMAAGARLSGAAAQCLLLYCLSCTAVLVLLWLRRAARCWLCVVCRRRGGGGRAGPAACGGSSELHVHEAQARQRTQGRDGRAAAGRAAGGGAGGGGCERGG